MSFIGKYQNTYNKIFYFFFIIFLFFFVAFRYEISWDWGNYSKIYEGYRYLSLDNVLAGGEPIFGLVNYTSVQLGFSDILFTNVIFALFVFFFLHRFLMRLQAYWLGLLIYFPVQILIVSMGYVRQSVAIAILLYAFLKLKDKKSFQFIFWVFIASLSHRTAIIMLMFWPITFFNLKGIWLYFYNIIALVVITAVLYLSTMSEASVYTSDQISSVGIYLRLILYVIPLFYYFLYRERYFKVEFPDFYKVLDFFVMLIGVCFVLSLVFTTLADRFSLYMVFFNLFVCMKLYFYLSNKGRSNLVLLIVLSYMLSFAVWKLFGFGADPSYIYQNYITNYIKNSVL
jgi:hypothetical protein